MPAHREKEGGTTCSTRLPSQPLERWLSQKASSSSMVKPARYWVLYPLLRVEIPKIKIERLGGFPPRLIRPMGMEPLDLEIDGHLSPFVTAKGHCLAKFA